MTILKYISKKKTLFYALALFIPMIIVLIGFKKMGLAPFGNKSLLSMDLWGQYFPMLVEQYNNGVSAEPHLFSWNGSLGFNYFAQSAYYCNSIFNVFMLFSSPSNLINTLDYLILIKFGLASLSCCIFLNYKFKKLNLLTVSFSIAYALCSYTIAFMNQTMWFDAVIYFPLILLGLEYLILRSKSLIYCAFLALSIYSNYYITFSICIFLVLYFISFIITNPEKKDFNFKTLRKPIINFIVFSLLAAGLVAFIVLPVYKSICLTIALESNPPKTLEFYNHYIEYISKLMPLTKTSLEYGIPNIYCGAFVFITIPLFITNKKIDTKNKIVLSALIIILYFSMNLNLLNYIWHGFHFPNQLPGRWSFIFSFVLILMSYKALINYDGITKKSVFISLFHALLFISMLTVLPKANISNDTIINVISLMVIYASILLYISQLDKVGIKKLLIGALSICIICEVGINAVCLFKRDVPTSDIQSYQHADIPMSKIIPKYQSGKDNFYRMEMHNGWTFNPGQLYNYKGISYYSSTMTGRAYNFYENIGYRVYAKNVSTVYNPFSPVLNSLFSMKYIVDKTNMLDLPGYESIETIDNYTILKNKYCLPIAFMSNNDLLKWNAENSNPIDTQNSFLNAVVGRDVNAFEKINPSITLVDNAKITQNKDWTKQQFTREDVNKPVKFTYKYTIDKDQIIYIQQNFKKGNMDISINNVTQKLDVNSDIYKSLGHVKAGDVVEVVVNVSDVNVGLWGIDLFSFNENNFAECYKELVGKSAEIIEFKDTNIKCKVKAEKSGLLYTSIPDDNGWTVKCNGKKLDIHRISDYLISVDVPEGENTLEFSYNVPGLGVGLVISLISFCIVVIFLLIQKKIIKLPFDKAKESDSTLKYLGTMDGSKIDIADCKNDAKETVEHGVNIQTD